MGTQVCPCVSGVRALALSVVRQRPCSARGATYVCACVFLDGFNVHLCIQAQDMYTHVVLYETCIWGMSVHACSETEFMYAHIFGHGVSTCTCMLRYKRYG